MKKISILSLIILTLLAGCKKDPDEPSLKGLWILDNVVVKEYLGGTLSNTDIEPGDGTTLDFQDNGNLVIRETGGFTDTITYTIQADSKVIIDGELYEVRDLTASNVALFIKEDYGGGDYDEIFINLKR